VVEKTGDSIPVMRVRGPRLDYALPRLRDVDNTRVFSNFGPQETELRERFAELLGVPVERVATASNATFGLMGAVAVSGETQWSVPSFTFPASPGSVLSLGLDLSFADIDEDWWLKKPEVITGGVMPVAPFGAAVDFERWQDVDVLVVDAAASLGAPPPRWEQMKPEWAVVYSLHATKILGSGEGAVVVFGSEEKANDFHAWTNFGFSGSRNAVLVGVNGKMSEIQAAYAHAALDGWPEEQDDWVRARSYALDVEATLALEGVPWSDKGVNPYWLVSFESEDVTLAVESALAESDIGTRRWWGFGCHTMPAFLDVPTSGLEKTNDVAARSLGLPMFRDLGEHEFERIRDAIFRVTG
jgi:dTDP-4-amino-4,6-dideoxygalactose transaminase